MYGGTFLVGNNEIGARGHGDAEIWWRWRCTRNSFVDMSFFSNFAALDELIQVIYQNIEKYVVLSNVSDDNWTIHVGQAEQGRWWLGQWTEADVTKLVVRMT